MSLQSEALLLTKINNLQLRIVKLEKRMSELLPDAEYPRSVYVMDVVNDINKGVVKASMRLTNALWYLAKFENNPPLFEIDVRRLRNCGAKTAAEFNELKEHYEKQGRV